MTYYTKLSTWSATVYSWCHENISGAWWVEEHDKNGDIVFFFEKLEDYDKFEEFLKKEN